MAAAATNSQKTCIFPPELIPCILSNLEKSDLLNFRLVSKSWNKDCLKILKTSEWKLNLYIYIIEEYIGFLRSSPAPQLILPLQLSLDFPIESDIMENISTLQSLLGEECIDTIDLNRELYYGTYPGFYDEATKKFLELLASVSKGLKELILLELAIELDLEKFSAITSHLEKVKLPKLESFKSTVDKEGRDVKVLFNYLVEDCPNLKSLDIVHSKHYEGTLHDWNIPFGTLQTLKVENFKPTLPFLQKIQECNPSLKAFHISKSQIRTDAEGKLFSSILPCLSSTLESLSFSVGRDICLKFPVMKKLKDLRYNGKWCEGKDYPVFQNFYELHSYALTFPTLETLDIHINLEEELKKPTFPSFRLPDYHSLNKLTIRSNSDEVVWHWSSEPFLEKLIVDLRFLSSKQTTVFRALTELELDCDTHWAIANPIAEKYLEKNINNFNELFPAVSKLSLKYYSESDEGDGCVEENQFVRILKRILLSINDDKLKEITILNSDRNFLAKALREMSFPPRILLENLEGHPRLLEPLVKVWQEYTAGLQDSGESEEGDAGDFKRKHTRFMHLNVNDGGGLEVFNGVEKIRMLPSWKTSEKPESNLDFNLISRCFPNLRHLDIPADWLAKEEKFRAGQIQSIRKLFRDVTINRVWY